MKKSELVFVIIFILAFMFTITWVYTYLRSREEFLKGKNEQTRISEMYRIYKDTLDGFEGREPNREERMVLLEKQKEYYQTITRAVTAYDTSIHSYTPFNKYMELSLDGLNQVGVFCTSHGEYQLAYNVYETIKIGPVPRCVELANKKSDEVYNLLIEQKREHIEKLKAKEEPDSSDEDN